MAMALGRGEGQSYADINMTPLIDNPLPNADPPTTLPEVINLSIDFDGTLSWNAQRVDRAKLRSYIGQSAAQKPQPEVHINADRFAKYEVVAQTLADLQ
jgi:biopolymer transport protein ExbD